ncbi:hypothetical protein VU12_13360, partial [Desulfobulbus sp. US4]|nr:hypothetical protein [Desulfobulbus sp. US4]
MADAENKLAVAIEALLPELQKKYPGENIEKNTTSIKCYYNDNESYRHVCIVPDYSLRTPPDLNQFKGMTLKWHDELKKVNPDAWKVQ